MIPFQYIWLVWVSLFLIPWVVLFIVFPTYRKIMWRVSLATTPFGLTEPLFVPEYWNPPTLFDLAQRTGFDLESLIFTFGIGGVGSVLYSILAHRNDIAVPDPENACLCTAIITRLSFCRSSFFWRFTSCRGVRSILPLPRWRWEQLPPWPAGPT